MPPPLVSVLLAAHDAERFLGAAVESVLRQTERDLELVVVDDGSTDRTPELLAAVSDPRLVVLRNDEQLGLAASLNKALGVGVGPVRGAPRRGRRRAATPDRASTRRTAPRVPRSLSSARRVLELDERGPAPDDCTRCRVGARCDALARALRLAVPASDGALRPRAARAARAPLRRAVRRERGLRTLVAPARRRRGRQPRTSRSCSIASIPARRRGGGGTSSDRSSARSRCGGSVRRRPALDGGARGARVAGRRRRRLPAGRGGGGGRTHSSSCSPASKACTARVARCAWPLRARSRGPAPWRAGSRCGPRCRARGGRGPGAAASGSRRATRPEAEADARPCVGATPAHRRRSASTVVSPEPTPYRSGLFDRVAERPEVDLTVLYAGRTVAGRTWEIEPQHRSMTLDGVRLPGVRRRPAPRLPGHARRLPRARRRAARGRRRLRLEHVRLAGGGALVPPAPSSVRPSRREQRPRSRARAGGGSSSASSCRPSCVARTGC